MDWATVRSRFPERWLVVEALQGCTTTEGRRRVEAVKVLEQCADGAGAYASYRARHKTHPDHEYYFVHTSRDCLEVEEHRWLGVRMPGEA